MDEEFSKELNIALAEAYLVLTEEETDLIESNFKFTYSTFFENENELYLVAKNLSQLFAKRTSKFDCLKLSFDLNKSFTNMDKALDAKGSIIQIISGLNAAASHQRSNEIDKQNSRSQYPLNPAIEIGLSNLLLNFEKSGIDLDLIAANIKEIFEKCSSRFEFDTAYNRLVFLVVEAKVPLQELKSIINSAVKLRDQRIKRIKANPADLQIFNKEIELSTSEQKSLRASKAGLELIKIIKIRDEILEKGEQPSKKVEEAFDKANTEFNDIIKE